MSNERIPVLWFDREGCGPDELALELHHFPAQTDMDIPAWLGLRVRARGIVINAAKMVDGGLNLHREQVVELHAQLGKWLEENK